MATNNAALNFILKLTDQVSAPLGKVKMGFNELAEKGQKNITQMGIGLAGMVGAGVAISKAMEPALEQNRALGEVKSLGVAQDALDALNRKSLAFSIAYGENAQAFVASAYSIEGAIKGLTGSQLATFTNTSNLLAKATKGDAETMSAYLGTMYNTFKGQADAMGKSAWVEQLGGQTALAVQLFRTSGAQIGEAFKAAGGLASTAGVDLAEQMAVLGTLGSTMEGGEAGGLYKAFFENISGASEKLGMSFVDQQGKLLPMMDILDKLQGKFGDLSIEANGKALRDAFGGEAARLITTLMGDTGRLANGMKQLGKVRGLETAEQMAKAMVDPWQQFGAAVQALRIAFGQALIPLLTPLMERLTGIAATLTRWIGLFPNIARVIGITVLAVLGLAAAIGAITFAVALAKTAWLPFLFLQKIGLAGFIAQEIALLALTLKMGALALWSKVAAASMWLFNAALWANPVTWVVIGIIALGAAIAAAIIYWDEITAAIMNTAAFQWVSAQLTALSDWFSSMGGWSGMARAAWDGILAIFYGAINGLIAMLNKIPGVEIDAQFGAMPDMPAAGAVMTASEQAERAQKAQATINNAIPSLSPQRANAVPPGGLLTSIQNTSNQNRGNHVEKVEIHTGKPMSPLELENMLSMAVGG
ncbi:phage tail tape measure protein [Stutzerimonas nitrititolerans]|uniref:phage tail tape measure protein n=1 Tax=Stutzerimonas nitrititolerans TaxID=2482751 RepID=UPI001BDC1638|nr:phage tail tape measure protein [Stutzerimonas nitrititolerans]MBT1120736.1 phage tail tape measure protein [Stutzerimonas nitrititolerans]